jgi:hypothetical protein
MRSVSPIQASAMLQSTKLLKGKVSVGIRVNRGSAVLLSKFTSSVLLDLQAKKEATRRKKRDV